MNAPSRILSLAVLVLLRAVPAGAFPCWIEPAVSRVAAGEALTVQVVELEAGLAQPTAGGESAPLRLQAFSGLRGRGLSLGVDAEGTAGLDLLPEGTTLLGCCSARRPAEVAADDFERMLADEGLDDVLLARAESAEDEEPGREVSSWSAKALVVVGTPDEGSATRRLGHPLELVLEAPPWAPSADGGIPLQVVFRGEPLGEALVTARPLDLQGASPLEARTDEAGRVRLPLGASGRWLVHVAHAVAAPRDLPPELEADWEIFRASLTFERPAPSRRSLPRPAGPQRP